MPESHVVVIPFGVPDEGRGLGLGLAALVHAFCQVDGGSIALAQLHARKNDSEGAAAASASKDSSASANAVGPVEAFVPPHAWRDIAGRGDAPAGVQVVLTGAFEPPAGGPGVLQLLAFDPRDGRTRARVDAPLDEAGAGASLVNAFEQLWGGLGGEIGALRGLRDLAWESLESVLRAERCALHDPARGGPHDRLAAMLHLGRAIFDSPEASYPVERLASLALDTASTPSVDTKLASAAARALERAVEDAPARVEPLEALAALELRLGQAAAAEDRLNAAIAAAPARPRLYALLSQALRAQGRNDAALEAAERGFAEAPFDPLLHSERGIVLASKGDFVGAAAAWRRALSHDDVHPAAFASLAALAIKQQDATTAQSLVDAALASPRASVEVLRRAVQLAMASETEGVARAARVSKLCTKLLERNPSDLWPLLVLAQSEVVLGEKEAARERFLTIERLAPKSLAASEAQFARVVLDDPALLSEIESVLRAARGAAAGDLDDVAARARRLATLHQAWPAWYAAGIAERRRGRHTAARGALDVALELSPGAGPVHVELAAMALELGDAALALTHAEQAVSLEGDTPRALLLKARVLVALDRIDEAEGLVRRVPATEPEAEALRSLIEQKKAPPPPSGFGERAVSTWRRWTKR